MKAADFKKEHGCTFAEFAKRHGLHRDTVRWRWIRGKPLTDEPRPALILAGKTPEQWSVWFACRGVERSADQVRSSYYWYRNEHKLTDKQAMECVKEHYLTGKKLYKGVMQRPGVWNAAHA